MNVCVMGAGAVGAYFGERLAAAGNSVSFVARGKHLAALQERGLEVHSTLGDARRPALLASDAPARIAELTGPADVVLFTVKSQDTARAAEAVTPLVGASTRLVTLQNGVDNVDQLVRRFGEERVWGGVAYIEAVVAAPGVVVHKSPFARVVVGPMRAGDDLTDGVREAFERAGVDIEVVDDPVRAIWEKWLFICAFSGLTALTRRPIGEVLARAETAGLLRRAMEEVAALARGRGVELPATIVDDRMRFAAERLEPSMTSSLAQDLAAGRRLELGALNGAASRLGRELGIPTPVNDFIHAALLPWEAGAA